MIRVDEIENTTLYKDYKKKGYIPSIDEILDWRNRLVELKKGEPLKYRIDWYNAEIKACDFLMTKYQEINEN